MVQPQLIYIGDPMCSWCWGIAPGLDALRDQFQDQISFRLVLGGLRPGGGDPWTPQFTDFLRSHWEHVHEASGQPFNFGLLERADFHYDTEPPCRAVRIVRDLEPEKEFDFFKSIQHRFYVENEDPGGTSFYQSLCEAHGVDTDVFLAHFTDDPYRQYVRADFSQSQAWGVRGFPSVLLQKENQLYPVTLGFTSFQKMQDRLTTLLAG